MPTFFDEHYRLSDVFVYALAGLFVFILACKIIYGYYEVLYPYLLGRPKDLHRLAGAPWAVVTGSTDGIGKAYAFELAKKKFNLILISRTQARLDRVAHEISEEHSDIEIKTIAFDFTSPNLNDYETRIFSVLDTLDVGLLVNNVGMAYEYPEKLHKIPGGLKTVSDLVLINTLPVTLLTAHVLKQMTSRNRGIIVNVASMAAYHPFIFMGIYTSVKEYMRWFGQVLRKEYSDTRIHIQTVCPGLVKTKMSQIVQDYPFMFAVTPQEFAQSAVRSIGLIEETTGCMKHQFQKALTYEWTPGFILDFGMRQFALQTRKRALRKLKAERAGTSGQTDEQDRLVE